MYSLTGKRKETTMFIHPLKRLVHRSYVASLLLLVFVAGCGSLPPAPMSADAAQSGPAAVQQQAALAQPTAAQIIGEDPATMQPPGEDPATMQPPGEDPTTMEPVNKLPAPLYMLSESGQIYRIEQDGVTRNQITFEVPANPDVPPITEFAVSPADGTLAYVVRAGNQDSLVLSEPLGPPRSALNFAPYRVSDLVWSPDGRALAVRLDSDTPNMMMPNGVYLVSPVYSEPGLFQADDPANPEQTNFSYAPVSWSPDGTQLLLKRFWKQISYCKLAVKSVENGARDMTPTVLAAPRLQDRESWVCDSATWSADSRAVYLSLETFIPERLKAGLWRADAQTGQVEPGIPMERDGILTLFAGSQLARDGYIYSFVGQSRSAPGSLVPDATFAGYAMSRIALETGDVAPLMSGFLYPTRVLWAADGSGAVVQQEGHTDAQDLVWLAAGSDGLLPLPGGDLQPTALAWGML